MTDSLLRDRAFVNGRWITAPDGRVFDVHSPSAIEAAHRAWPAWRALTARERGAVLRRRFELIVQHRTVLADATPAMRIAREGSRYGLDAYLETRYLCFGGV